MSPTDQSLRGVLTELEAAGELARIRRPVSLRYELSALLAVTRLTSRCPVGPAPRPPR